MELLSEIRWKGTGEVTINKEHKFMYNGHGKKHIQGISLIVNKNYAIRY